jgi:mycofactocin precursor
MPHEPNDDRPLDEPQPAAPAETPEIEEDLLIEDVSIDGMCGVY